MNPSFRIKRIHCTLYPVNAGYPASSLSLKTARALQSVHILCSGLHNLYIVSKLDTVICLSGTDLNQNIRQTMTPGRCELDDLVYEKA